MRVGCAGGLYIDKDERDIADTMIMTMDYPDEYTVLLVTTHTNGGTKHPMGKPTSGMPSGRGTKAKHKKPHPTCSSPGWLKKAHSPP